MSCMMMTVKQIEYEIDRGPKQSFPSTKPRPTYRVSPAGAKISPPESDLVTFEQSCKILNLFKQKTLKSGF